MTTDYKACLVVEGRNRAATELKIQSKLLQYQALALESADEALQQNVRAEVHALVDMQMDHIAIQMHCIKNLPAD